MKTAILSNNTVSLAHSGKFWNQGKLLNVGPDSLLRT